MRIERFSLGDSEPADSLVARVRGLVGGPQAVSEAVAGIIERVRHGGDQQLGACVREFDTRGADPPPLSASRGELEAALERLDPDLRAALSLTIANVTAVAEAGLMGDAELVLEQGQRVLLRELPVARAAVYVPGGRAPYPSTVVMGAVTARVAGVAHVTICSPPGPAGDVDPAILGACALCGVDAVLRMGGAHAIAALAYGTETVPRVDVIAGPGSLYVQEAKRMVARDVGIDGFHGPSDLLVILDGEAGELVDLAARDLLAQAEHGPDSLVVAVATTPGVLTALAERLVDEPATERLGVCALVCATSLDRALAFADALAPEHLQLMGTGAERLASEVRCAGCVFVGASSATAFGDYVAGSNHILPTGGAARFGSGLSPRDFRRRAAQVTLGPGASALAGAGAALARAEGFELHARSMEARAAPQTPTGIVGDNRKS